MSSSRARATNNYFGISLAAGDFNADGTIDLAVGARGYSSSYRPRAYTSSTTTVHTRPPPRVPTSSSRVKGSTNQFGNSLVAGDFNADGKTDLSVGAPIYSSNTGRVYIFYNDGSYPTGAASADVIIQGETTRQSFRASNLFWATSTRTGETIWWSGRTAMRRIREKFTSSTPRTGR
jgi:hypothetical protein